MLLGTLAFAGLGLLMAGALRAEATLALANGLFIGFLLLGGIVLPVSHLPGPLAAVADLLPAAALADAFRVALGSGQAIWDARSPCSRSGASAPWPSPRGRSAGSEAERSVSRAQPWLRGARAWAGRSPARYSRADS